MASVITAGTTSTTALNLTGDTSGELQIKTNNGSTTAMTLTTAGNVGIGTVSPLNKLNVNAGSAGAASARFTDGTNSTLLVVHPSSGVTGIDGYGALAMLTGGSERMRIDSSGNVGIGTSSPATKLHVLGGNTTIQSSTSGDGNIRLTNTGASYLVGMLGSANSTALSFYDLIAGAERMRIDSSGNVFFKGTYVSFNDTGYIRCDVSNSLALQSGSSTSVGFQLRNAGNGATPMLSMNGLSGGSLALEGATPQTGVGITFPATQSASSDANTLDDYEEGTFTPTLFTDSGSATAGGQTCNYTKIGNIVNVSGSFNVSSVSSPGGLLRVTNLPFTTSTVGVNGAGGAVSIYNTASSYSSYTPWVYTINTLAQFYIRFTTGTAIIEGAALLKTGTEIWFNVTYRAA